MVPKTHGMTMALQKEEVRIDGSKFTYTMISDKKNDKFDI